MSGSRALLILTAVCQFAVLAACVPWTVRPIGDSSSTKAVASPAAYVDSIWDSKLLPALAKSATDARTLLDAIAASPEQAGQHYGHRESGGAWYFAIEGSGRVLSVDTSSRNGLLLIDVAPFDKVPDVSIQIGPVIRGSALRDATGTIRFTDFVNQLQFADVENELNNRVLRSVVSSLDTKSLAGRMVEFTGAFGMDGTGKPAIHGIVPVSLRVDSRP